MIARISVALAAAIGFAATARAATLEVRVVDAAGKPVADAAVFAQSASGSAAHAAPRQRKATIEQVDREFVPHVTMVQTGTAVTFPNRDPILHHVYSFSPAKTFEIKLYTGKSPSEIVFDKPGVVTLGCNIHDWMIGYIVVVDTPYFAKTNDEGVARIADVPKGGYELRAWHPQQRAAGAPQAMNVDADTRPTLTLDVAPRKAKYKPPLDKMRY
jgi:plastocyanin